MVASADAAQDCSINPVLQPSSLPATALSPVASELHSRSSQLGMPSGVLTQSHDPAESLERVLLRFSIENCRNNARASVPAPTAGAVINPNDPAAYKPQTEYDNTPWRFDMTQNGKRMTADEFDEWMKARGIRVARGPAVIDEAAADSSVEVK
jgi:hypothetical protein